jgi:hypothetical protein
MEEVKCKFCQKSFLPNRLGMKFCRPKCRDDFKNRKRAFEKRATEREDELKKVKDELIKAKQEEEVYHGEKADFDKETEKLRKQEASSERIFRQLDSLTREQRYEQLWKDDLRKLEPCLEKTNFEIFYKIGDEQFINSRLKEYEKFKVDTKAYFKRKRLKRFLTYPIFNEDPKLKKITDQIENLEQRISELERKEVFLDVPKKGSSNSLTKESIGTQQGSSEHVSTMKKYSAQEVLKMKFDTFTISSELGEFLGNLDRNMLAFALTGDAGAGKSYFSYQLTKLFVDNNFRVAYFSFEEGLGQITKDKFIQYGIESKVDLITGATYEEVDQESELYDVIIIDSFSKLNRKASDYDLLRQRHPKNIFVVIFQKTTGKTIRGGSAITFDSSAIINVTAIKDENNIVKDRLAKMKKSRYGTTGWVYSITEEKIEIRS